jgi:hypothetical protein
MAVSRALQRLLRIRFLEEEQSRLALESALAELWRLEHALEGSDARDRRGRCLVEASARSGELPDRLAGLEESRAAARVAALLAPRIASAEAEVVDLRQEFLDKRIERRQADTLIRETEDRDAIDTRRRGQQALDDWYGSGLRRAAVQGEAERPVPARPSTEGSAPAEEET